MKVKKFGGYSIDDVIAATEVILRYTHAIGEELDSDVEDKSEAVAAALFSHMVCIGVLHNLSYIAEAARRVRAEAHKTSTSEEEKKSVPTIDLSAFVKNGVKS